ncbi:unnamed protein product [Plutella xylostella]|uniref:(diamondback moth) hypothetical protein n=1 Tax=Plutella xylostella TaxID=51655 RepID=A0A8S4F4T7_PLUXY|nr:unnamed protein product [Plutella xylostella]
MDLCVDIFYHTHYHPVLTALWFAWVLGWLMCKTVPYVQGLSVAASVYSLVAVSLDRTFKDSMGITATSPVMRHFLHRYIQSQGHTSDNLRFHCCL